MKICEFFFLINQIKNFLFRFNLILPYVDPDYAKLQNPPFPNLCGVDTNQGWMDDLSQWVIFNFFKKF